MKLIILVGLLLIFVGCNNTDTTIKDFKNGKELSCSRNTLFTLPTIISNKTWEYSKNLEVFYKEATGTSFPISSCESK
jgi:hypothetical protein